MRGAGMMRSKKSVFLILFLMLVTALVVYEWKIIERLEKQPSSRKSDARYIERAVDIWASKGNENKKTVMANRYAIVVRFPKEVCVQLRLNVGSVGGSPIYCFEKQSARLLRREDEVE